MAASTASEAGAGAALVCGVWSLNRLMRSDRLWPELLSHQPLADDGAAASAVTTSPDGTFTARLRTGLTEPAGAQPPPASFAGRWLAAGGLMLTAIAVPRR